MYAIICRKKRNHRILYEIENFDYAKSMQEVSDEIENDIFYSDVSQFIVISENALVQLRIDINCLKL
jgi:hypothetical protein